MICSILQWMEAIARLFTIGFQGVRNYVVGEGTHFIIPWVQKPIIYDVRSRPRNVPVVTGSKGADNFFAKLMKNQGGFFDVMSL